MSSAKILVLAGSFRTGSFNARLAALAAKRLALAGAEPTLISLADYDLPLYNADDEARSGPPHAALALKRQFCAHQGVFIASPEYNASVTPLLKNALDWVSRVRESREPPLAAYKNRLFAIAAASDGMFGGLRSLMALRQILELGCGAMVLPEQVALRGASTAFDAADELVDERTSRQFTALLNRLIAMAPYVAAPEVE